MGRTCRLSLAFCAVSALTWRPVTAGGAPTPSPGPSCIDLPPPPRDKALRTAVDLYDREQLVEAIERLRRIVDDPDFREEDRQRAAFTLGKALFRLKLFVGSVTVFSEIAATGTTHIYNLKSVEWLAALTQYVPHEVGAVAALARYPLSTLDRPSLDAIRDVVLVDVARQHLRERNVSAALEALAARKREPLQPTPPQPTHEREADELERAARAVQDGRPDGGTSAAIGPDADERARTRAVLRSERQQVDLLPTYCNGRVVPWLRTLLEARQRSAR